MTLTYLELYRRKSGLTTKQLAIKAGYIPNAISQIECGHRKSWPMLRAKIAEILEVPETELFNLDGSINVFGTYKSEHLSSVFLPVLFPVCH
ncbi:MAG: helix-turn-helix domain-containing protein [Bacillota bacterium]